MSEHDRERIRISRRIDHFLEDKSTGKDTGNYRRNAGRVVREFVEWLEDGGPPPTGVDAPEGYEPSPEPEFESVERFGDLEVRHLVTYARQLRQRVWDDEIAGSTARTYFNYIRAFCEWAVEEEYLSENPAKKKRVSRKLPDDTPAKDRQQVWSPDERAAICRAADDAVQAALDDRELDEAPPLKPVRDRALVYLLAYSGVRGAEVLQARHDDRRQGATWADLNLDANQLMVLGKGGDEKDPARVLTQAHDALERWRDRLDPPTDWPLFPTCSRAALANALPDSAPSFSSPREALERYRDVGAVPPAMTTDGARTVLRSLSERGNIDPDGEADYLQLHGARRGLGDELYDENPRLAQDVLRHQSITTTHESYREQKAEADAEEASEIVDAPASADE